MTVKEIVQNFYEGLAQKNDDWQRDLSESIVFSDASGKLKATGRDAFIQSFSTFLRAVEQIEVKKLIAEDNIICAVVSYDYVSQSGNTLHQGDAEVWEIVDEKIVSLTIYFDITEFRNFMIS